MTDESSRDTRFATVLRGDVAGYSKLTADNEIETHNTLQAFRRIIEEAVRTNNGDLASFVGDEFLAVLPTESDALAAAIEIQRRIASENESLPAGRKMRFRRGVNAGDISVADSRWYGDAINVAARLQALAEPGGINVSRSTLDAAGDIPARVESLGPQRLKNIPERSGGSTVSAGPVPTRCGGARSRPPDAARTGCSLVESQPPIPQQGQPRPVHRRTRGCRTGVSPRDPGQSRLPV